MYVHCANLVEYRSIFKNIYFRKEVGHIPLLYLKEVKTILPSIEVTLVEILLQTAASYLISKDNYFLINRKVVFKIDPLFFCIKV
jgi:hypothetical protein